MSRQTNGQTDEKMDVRIDGRMYPWTDGHVNQWTARRMAGAMNSRIDEEQTN